jgi:twitching motility protein PilT
VTIDELFAWVLEVGASDLHLKAGQPPAVRLDGSIVRAESPPFSAAQLESMLMPLLPAHAHERLQQTRSADFATVLRTPEGSSRARFRCSLFYQMGQLGGVFRLVPAHVRSLQELGMPPVLQTLLDRDFGLVLVTGPTGSGKSTTLAAMIDHINSTREKHILTIEDPVEMVHTDKLCLVNQREVGTDTPDFSDALRCALRQDPDVILIGEMRDAETVRIAMTAAETGHLVLSTLHTNDAKQTIERILNIFSPDEQPAVRTKLAATLWAIVSQRLLARRDGGGRLVVQEILLNSPSVRKLIEEAKTAQIDKVLEDSTEFYGMQSANQHLLALWQQGLVSEDDCLSASNNPGDLRVKLQTLKYSHAATTSVPPSQRPLAGGLESRFG